MQAALHEVEGTYGIAVICKDEPDTLVVARKGCPLIIGVGKREYIVASDASAIVEHTSAGDLSERQRDGRAQAGWLPHDDDRRHRGLAGHQQLEHKLEEYELGDYEHYMLKEIFEQPNAVRNCLRGRAEQREGRIVLGGIADHTRELVKAKRFILTGQGTAWHAGLVGDYLMEDLAKVVTECTYASEFRYRNPLVEENTVVVAISQSGETADTLAALREGERKKARRLGVVNVVGSTIARETDAGIYLHAGPEIGVASTKAFTCQCVVLTMLALFLGRRKFMSQAQCQEMIDGLCAIPDQMQKVLDQSEQVKDIADKFCDRENWLFLGPRISLSGRAGRRAEAEGNQLHPRRGNARGRDEARPDRADQRRHAGGVRRHARLQYDKVISNIEEVRARGGQVIAVATEGDTQHPPLQRSRHLRARRARAAAAAAERGAAATAGVSRGGASRVQRGQAEESGEERDGGVMGFLSLSFEPFVDVYFVEKLGVESLLHGHNPYAMTFRIFTEMPRVTEMRGSGRQRRRANRIFLFAA